MGVTRYKLIYYLYKNSSLQNYNTFRIRKRTGGSRVINAPVTNIKLLQRTMSDILSHIYRPRMCVTGFVPGRSNRDNAINHVRSQWVLNVDLKDFFPSIHFGRVRGMLMSRPYELNKSTSTLIAQLCCANGVLPQGAPTSPVIANMICARLDGELSRLAKKYRCTYSRYADDLSFSSKLKFAVRHFVALGHAPDSTRHNITDELRSIIESNGFAINADKVKLMTRTTRQQVTGVVVNQKPNLSRTYIRSIRGAINAVMTYGYKNAETVFKSKYYFMTGTHTQTTPSLDRYIRGRLAYLRGIIGESGPVYRKYANLWASAMGEPKLYINDPFQDLPDTLWVLESLAQDGQGTAFSLQGVGIVTCAHVLREKMIAFKASNPSLKYNVFVKAKNDELDVAIIGIDCEARYSELTPADPSLIKVGDRLVLAGYPNRWESDTGYIIEVNAAGFRTKSLQRWIVVNGPIVTGNSGGPVLNTSGKVIGIAATGADSFEKAFTTEHHGVIPITSLDCFRTASTA